jgi:hypothetical protein
MRGEIMSKHVIRIALLLLFPFFLLTACDHSVDDKLAAQAAAEHSLGISPSLFATKFNRAIADVLEDRKDEGAGRMAPLYTIDVTQLHSGGEKHTFQTQVGPSQTSMMGSLAKDGDLKTIGVLLSNRSEGARMEFLLCAEATSRLVTDGDKKKLPDLIKRLVNNALNNPGQRMTEVIGDKLISTEIIQQGLMFQIEHK